MELMFALGFEFKVICWIGSDWARGVVHHLGGMRWQCQAMACSFPASTEEFSCSSPSLVLHHQSVFVAPTMLCSACQEIFSRPRQLAYASIAPWGQTPQSFRRSLADGCHLCTLIEENRSYNDYRSPHFPRNVNYAFKPLNPEWARSGSAFKWYAYQHSYGDDEDPSWSLQHFREGVLQDPTPNRLGTLLATDAPNLAEEAAESWIVLEFFGDEQILLPVEICTQDPLEQLAQFDLKSQSWTGRSQTLQLARMWVENCHRSHSSCRPRQSEAWLPTRLIDVGSDENPVLQLVNSAPLVQTAPYVALSHRWGANQTLILRSEKVNMYQEAIPDSEVSNTVRDAAIVTRSLGIRYLWVDCMCIIQDDDGQDWARESDTMFKVYSLSTCTIAAANSGDGEGGFLTNRDQYRVRPCHVPSPFKTASEYSFKIMSQYLNKIHDVNVRNSEWFNRGWVFQERMLAPRLLIFTKSQVLWGCAELQAAETWPCGKTNENFIDQFNSVEAEKARLNELLHFDRGITKSHDAWWTFLQDYMSSQLTVWSDRLVAIRGIATLVEGITGKQHCAGMWLTDDFPSALLWHIKGEPPLRSGIYLAPSFSWAAVGCRQVEFAKKRQDQGQLIVVEEAIRLERNLLYDNTRNIREALRVTGSLLPCSLLTGRSGLSIEKVMIREEGEKWVETVSAYSSAARECLLTSS